MAALHSLQQSLGHFTPILLFGDNLSMTCDCRVPVFHTYCSRSDASQGGGNEEREGVSNAAVAEGVSPPKAEKSKKSGESNALAGEEGDAAVAST